KEETPAEEPDKQKPTEVVIIKDKRIAIRQATANKTDNPDAPRVADEANTVDDETQARFRSTDSVSADPSLGEKHDSAEDDEGNSARTKVAQTEVADGD